MPKDFICISLLILLIGTQHCLSQYSNNCKGICQPTSFSCPASYQGGLCPGDSSIKCCPMPTPQCPGQCQITSLSCDLGYVAGDCPGNASIQCCKLPPLLPCVPAPPPRPLTFLLTLQNQGFPGHPGAHCYIPALFSSTEQAFGIVIYIHGFQNCIENCVLPTACGCNCSTGQPHRDAYSLFDQFAAVANNVSESSTLFHQFIFVAIEVAYDEATSDPGHWADPGLFKSFLVELLNADNLGPYTGNRTIADVDSIKVFSHSGGYQVAADLWAVGGVPDTVLEICLLDSLYGSIDTFTEFIQTNLQRGRLGASSNMVRFQSIYTDGGGTAENNINMATSLQTLLAQSNQSSLLLFDQTTNTLSASDYRTYPLLFKRSALAHNDVPRYYFEEFLRNSP